MSLYNFLFGVNEEFPCLLGMVGMIMSDFERFRDANLCDKGENILVLTRCGGENRKDHPQVFEKARSNENYLEDYDDSYDDTYCYIKFRVPEKYKETAKYMFKGEPKSLREKFEEEIKKLEDPNSEARKKAETIARNLEEFIKNNNGGIFQI